MALGLGIIHEYIHVHWSAVPGGPVQSDPAMPCQPASKRDRAWHGMARTGRTGPGHERRMSADEFVVHPIRALTVDRSSRSPLMIDKPDPHSYLVLSAPSSTFATVFLPFPPISVTWARLNKASPHHP